MQIDELEGNLSHFGTYLPVNALTVPDWKETTSEIVTELTERLKTQIVKVDHSFAMKNYKYVMDNIQNETVKKIYQQLGPFDHF